MSLITTVIRCTGLQIKPKTDQVTLTRVTRTQPSSSQEIGLGFGILFLIIPPPVEAVAFDNNGRDKPLSIPAGH